LRNTKTADSGTGQGVERLLPGKGVFREMTGARVRHLLSTGLGALALAATGSLQAQTIQLNPAPRTTATPIAPPVPTDSQGQSSSGRFIGLENDGQQGSVSMVEPPSPVTSVTSSARSCSCGERHGVSRWWYHRTRCKRHLQEWALGYPEEFNEWPLGSSLYAHGRTQVANGNAARMVFYHYDFVEGSAQLNLRGHDKLVKLANLLPASFCPIVIERTPDAPGLDEHRRALLLAELAGCRFPIPPERVVIGPPPTAGLAGFEAIFVYGNQLRALRDGIASGVGGYSGSPGLNAGGLSGDAIGPGFGGGGFGR